MFAPFSTVREPVSACRYTGMEGVYTHTVKYEKDPACPMCSASVPLRVSSRDTLQQVGSPFHAQGFEVRTRLTCFAL